jgi:hypothetical protein
LVVLVHFAMIEGDTVRPLCGDWSGFLNWTRVNAAVTCPRCRELLERAAVSASL